MKLRKKMIWVMVLSAAALFCLITDAYRRGEIKVYGTGQKEYAEQKKTKSGGKSTGSSKKSVQKENAVRVLLKTDQFADFYHEKVGVTCNKAFTVTVDNKTKKYDADKTVVFKKEQSAYRGKTVTISGTDGARLKITSMKRQDRNPSYRGKMELKWHGKGFTVINELPVEQYLYAVVPSELSTGHKMEALKAQSVCARSYAYNQIAAGRYKKYGADLDDSVSCQVYNNVPEDKRSRKAVKSTEGQVITRNGKIVVAYYYSTSWGKSASGKEVWDTSSEISYLQSSVQVSAQERKKGNVTNLDLSSDQAFRQFIDQGKTPTYDSRADWYRWNVTIPVEHLSERVDSALSACYASDRSKVLTQSRDGSYQSKSLVPLGKIRKIRVEKREKSGIVTELVVVGENNTVKVCTQYHVRKVLAPLDENVHYGAGTTTMTMLPSAAFYLQEVQTKNGLKYLIKGGGFGHGTGMSQRGAARMAELGENYQNILKYYFSGCKVEDGQLSR